MLFSFHGEFSVSSSLLFLSGFFQWAQYGEKEQLRLKKGKLKTEKGKIGKPHENQQLMMAVKERDAKSIPT